MSDPNIDPAATSAGAATALAAGEWALDPDNSRAEFAVKHFWGLVTVRGHFNEIAGELSIDPAGAVAGELRIDAASLDTGNKQRDKHLRSADFFGAEEHLQGRFQALRRAAGRRFGARDGRTPHNRRARGAPDS
jgi:polyisoprenoid-binding protein YceI